MRNRVPHTLVALVALVSIPPVARPGDPKTYEIPRRETWRSVDGVTETLSDSQKQTVKTSRGDGTVVQDVTTASGVEAAWVEQVVEADERGDVKKAVVFFKEWSATDREKKDASLKGATVEVAGSGQGRAWRFVGAEDATPAAKSWLDARFGPDDGSEEAKRNSYLPSKPVAVGESWDMDLKPLLRSSAKCLAPDPAKAKGTCTLVGVEGGQARIAFTISLPLPAFPCDLAGKAAAWAHGGTLMLAGERSAPLDGRALAARHFIKGSLAGAATVEGSQGSNTVALTQQMSEEGGVAPGGDIPRPPRVGPPTGK